MSLILENKENALLLDGLLLKSGSFLLVGRDTKKIQSAVKDLAKKIACSEALPSEFCDNCRDCQLTELGQHPDICWITPSGASAKIKIEDIRVLREKINLRPYQIKRKIFIITDAQRMGPEAANALLKTLEEPPLNASLVLIAQNTEELLQTVVSRCQLIRFADHDNQPSEDFEQINELLEGFFDQGNQQFRLNFYEDIAALDRAQVELLLNELAYIMRDILMFKLSGDNLPLMSMQQEKNIILWKEMFDLSGVETVLEEVLYTGKCIKRNANVKLAIDLLIKKLNGLKNKSIN